MKTQTLEDLTYLKRNVLAWLEYGEGIYSDKDGALLFEKDVNKISNSVRSVDEGAINDAVISRLISENLQSDYGYSMLEAELWVKNNGGCVVSDMWDAYSEYIRKNIDYSVEGR